MDGTEFINNMVSRIYGVESLREVVLEPANHQDHERFYGKSCVMKSAQIVEKFVW